MSCSSFPAFSQNPRPGKISGTDPRAPEIRKTSPFILRRIGEPDNTTVTNNRRTFILSFTGLDRYNELLAARQIPVRILYRHAPLTSLEFTIPAGMAETEVRALLRRLLELPGTRYLDQARKPRPELVLGRPDLALNTVRLAQRQYPGLDGSTEFLSVKENAIQSFDLDVIGRYIPTAFAPVAADDHASIMATLAGGAGNTGLQALGAAYGVRFTSTTFDNLFPEPDTFYINNGIRIQNHSYGTAIENYYGAEAEAFDRITHENPHLIHVFSAGNSGALAAPDGVYAGLNGWANLTGTFKMAKNVLTVGAQDPTGAVETPSSRGPAYDGRIKPELVAFGDDGSSGAAAITSGTCALINQYHQQLTGQPIRSDLARALLLAGARDIHTPGPDFISGYGSLQAHTSLNILKNGQYGRSTISTGNVYSKIIPVNEAGEMRILLAWLDPAAPLNAGTALVNDLDLEVRHLESGAVFRPWILDPRPDVQLLQQPATRGTDRLNNQEMVSLTVPGPGTYEVRVSVHQLTTASQDFALAWSFYQNEFFGWSFPLEASPVPNREPLFIRWDTRIREPMELAWSANAGQDWNRITDIPDVSLGYHAWNPPPLNGPMLLRLKNDSREFITGSFILSDVPDITTGLSCADSTLLSWSRVPQAASYRVQGIRETRLATIAETTDTFYVIQKSAYTLPWVSIEPVFADGEGVYTGVINTTQQGVGCYVRNLDAFANGPRSAGISLELGSLYNVREVRFFKIGSTGERLLQDIALPQDLTLTISDPALTNGLNRYIAEIELVNGSVIRSNTDEISYFGSAQALVFPNPVPRGQTLKVITRDLLGAELYITDMWGRLVQKKDTGDVFNEISTQHWSPGLYLIRLQQDGRIIYREKFLVQ